LSAEAPLVGSDGYCVVDDLLSRSDVRRIRRWLRRFHLPADHDFFASPAHAPGPVAEGFDRDVKRLVSPRLAQLVPGYRPFMVAVTSKGRHSAMPIKFHQDWTYTDERSARPLFIWCPLVDVDQSNGALQVVAGSHRWTSGIRPSRRIEVTEAVQDQLRDLARPAPMRAGQGLAFDPAICHGSPPNPTRRPRPAITIALAPAGAPLVHFHLSEDGHLSGHEVDDRFFTTNPYGTEPVGRPTVAPWDRPVTVEDLDAGMSAAGARVAT
jgi:hypothetical protein